MEYFIIRTIHSITANRVQVINVFLKPIGVTVHDRIWYKVRCFLALKIEPK